MSLTTLYRIGKRPSYIGLFLGILSATLIAIALFPNLALLREVVEAEVVVTTKITTLVTLITSLPAAFSTVTLLMAIGFAMLLALNLTLLTYYVRRRRVGAGSRVRIGAASLGGLVSGVLGIGCAACGSIVLSVLVTTFGGVGVLALLPYGGSEFAVLGLGLLFVSSVILLRHISDPLVCRT